MKKFRRFLVAFIALSFYVALFGGVVFVFGATLLALSNINPWLPLGAMLFVFIGVGAAMLASDPGEYS